MGDADKLLTDLNDRQREAVTTLAAPLAILAGAGSGKTRVLTRRVAWLAAEGALGDEGEVGPLGCDGPRP